MGIFIDNTNSRFGKFKPWIAVGAVLTGIFTVLLYTDFGLRGTAYVVMFTIVYLCWDVSFTANDIGYWSMLPSLSIDQKEREKIGLCANLRDVDLCGGCGHCSGNGGFGEYFGSMTKAYFVFQSS